MPARILFAATLFAISVLCAAAPAADEWQPKQARLMTRWAKEVTPDKALPEYPRPQMVRTQWQNLNGLWDYQIVERDKPAGEFKADGKILVPFPIESALSGVMKGVQPTQTLIYQRKFAIPFDWKGKRVLLHFGAVDWECEVLVNGKSVGKHRGGYDPFKFDVTAALKEGGGEQTLTVNVNDPTDKSWQPRGKQILRPHGIWYTPITGIWQTVWLEPVWSTYIDGLTITPDVDAASVKIVPRITGDQKSPLKMGVYDGEKPIAEAVAKDGEFVVKLSEPKLWSPDSPFLYRVQISMLGPDEREDRIESYFAMRKISLGKDEKGVNRLLLNNKFVFQYGPLDQGFWPDGLYTAPTDEALKYDLDVTKRLGFNMVRKHVKVEPARWYYWCDKLGLLVWQDMPSGDRYIGERDPDIQRTKESAENFEREWKAIIDALRNHPSIVMWVPFNEGWGQYDTARIAELTAKHDPTRLVNAVSGWADRRVGDVWDWHVYPGPASPQPSARRAAVLGEFGGLGLPLEGHTWLDKGNWGYRSYANSKDLTAAYVKLLQRLHPLIAKPGLSAGVYTQTTDVEIEVNGFLTYDRAVLKMDEKAITEAAKLLYTTPPEYETLVATSLPSGQESPKWRYTTDKPADGWEKPGFDDSKWKEGTGGFGERTTPGSNVNTEWKTDNIWIRRTFELPDGKLPQVALSMHHDEDATVYLNGVLATKETGYTTEYTMFFITPEAAAALKPGKNTIAIHCKQTGGGQYIDAGLLKRKE